MYKLGNNFVRSNQTIKGNKSRTHPFYNRTNYNQPYSQPLCIGLKADQLNKASDVILETIELTF